MRKIIFVILALILICAIFSGVNGNPKFIVSGLLKNRHELKPGQLHYKIYFFGFLPMGEAFLDQARLEEYNGQKAYHLTAKAQSLKLISGLYNAVALIDSYIDSRSLNPIYFKETISNGKQTVSKEVFYDQKKGVMTLEGVKRQILPDTQDPLSAVYKIRNMDFDKTQDIEMNINTNHKNYILKGAVDQKDFSVKGKELKLIIAKATIKRRDDNPYHKSNIEIILLEDKESLPVLINVFAGGVKIKAKLIEIN